MVDNYSTYQGELYDNPNSVDINSEEFASLPPEMKHEILKDMKEFSKRRRTMYQKPPQNSGDFSQYQLTGLLQRNLLNQRLGKVEKEMCERSAGSAPQVYEQDSEQKSHSIESNRLVSEDHSHYILIKGSKKSEIVAESRPAAARWCGGFQGGKRRAAGRPEPLWRPACDEQDNEPGPSSEVPEPSPPSPCTLKAIQAAMTDSSDKEDDQIRNGSGASPRTLLAIQQALAEEENPFVEQAANVQISVRHPAPRVVLSSSDDEPQDDTVKSSPQENLNLKWNNTKLHLHEKDSLLESSSEEDGEEVVVQRNLALLPPRHERGTKSNDESNKAQLSVDGRCGEMEIRQEMEEKVTFAAPICAQPQDEQRRPRSTEAPEKTEVNSEASEESDSKESFIEVSEEEFKQEDVEPQTEEKGSPDDVRKVERKPEDNWEEDPTRLVLIEEEDTKSPTGDEGLTEGAERGGSSSPAVNEWEQFDAEELEALESSLQAEQSSLRELKQQQERMANTVTGQMYLESQELLQLFGVPFLVAPMEAEAQCAALDRDDHTHGTITDDSDVWLFGGRHVYKNFFSQNKYVEYFQYSDLQNVLGLDRAKLINLAYLLGSDYTEGVAGVGYVTGMEVLNEFTGPGLEPLIQFSKWWVEAQEKKRLVADPRDTKVKKKLRELKLHPGFPNPAVAQAYLQPCVDQAESSFSWGRPQVDMLKEFCLNRFGWNSRRTEETLQPVMKQLSTQQTQMRIDSFFHMAQQEKNAIRSQRLRRAVTCMKRKERNGGEDGEEGSEEESSSLSKSKRGKVASKGSNTKGATEGEREVVGGGFLGSEVTLEPLKEVSCTNQVSQLDKGPHSAAAPSQRDGKDSDSSSSDDNGGGGREVAMVTARSVFESSRRGCRGKSTRGRGNARGRGKKSEIKDRTFST
ncbi:DNA repair protein complementing XP-G cells isoform X2 [Takifugu rubripes]|nr:DNA repair protein complementing XP-G cells isoform X2 [Takifugu rubripes]